MLNNRYSASITLQRDVFQPLTIGNLWREACCGSAIGYNGLYIRLSFCLLHILISAIGGNLGLSSWSFLDALSLLGIPYFWSGKHTFYICRSFCCFLLLLWTHSSSLLFCFFLGNYCPTEFAELPLKLWFCTCLSEFAWVYTSLKIWVNPFHGFRNAVLDYVFDNRGCNLWELSMLEVTLKLKLFLISFCKG